MTAIPALKWNSFSVSLCLCISLSVVHVKTVAEPAAVLTRLAATTALTYPAAMLARSAPPHSLLDIRGVGGSCWVCTSDDSLRATVGGSGWTDALSAWWSLAFSFLSGWTVGQSAGRQISRVPAQQPQWNGRFPEAWGPALCPAARWRGQLFSVRFSCRHSATTLAAISATGGSDGGR